MREDLAIEARNKAGNYFREGYNCAEAIFLTFREYLAPETPREAVKMTTGLGGGLGHAGCMCGALTGSVLAMGLLKGRTSAEKEREPMYDAASGFHDRFIEKFGYTCCRALNPHPFETPEHLKNCLKITGNTAMLLTSYLDEKGLWPGLYDK